MIGTLLKDTVKFYWRNLNYFAAIILPLAIPVEIFTLLLELYWVNDSESLTQRLPSVMASLIIFPIYHAALIIAVTQIMQGKRPNTLALWAMGRRFWFGVMVVNICYFAAVLLGLFMLILPGIFISVRLVLAEQNVVLNQETPAEALKSSWRDTEGKFWLVFFGGLILGSAVTLISLIIFGSFNIIGNESPLVLILPTLMQYLLYSIFIVYLIRVRHYIRHNE